MKLERLKKFYRLVIGGHMVVLTDTDLNEMRSLLGSGDGHLVLHRMPTSAEMRRMAPCDSIIICSENLNMMQGHSKAKRLSKGAARFAFRKLDEKHAIMVRIT